MNLPQKLQQGQNIYKDGIRVINGIIDYLNSAWITGDNRTIKVTPMQNQVMISSMQKSSIGGGASSTPADEYTGYFKILDTSSNGTAKVSIVDGAYPDALTCGIYSFGSSGSSINKIEITISGNVKIWLEITFDTQAKTCTAEIKSGAELPNNSITKDIMLIGTAYASGGYINSISQAYQGAVYTILNRWTV